VGAYRVAFDRRTATLGLQPGTLAKSRVWVLPSTSGLNANHRPADFARAFAELKRQLPRR
jgi:TDG/mug DNA glycosylase family protein